MITLTKSKPRNPWPIVIIAYFAIFIAGLVTFIGYATTQHVDLVRPDYYEEEIRFQQQMDRIARTRQIVHPLTVTYDAGQHAITIRLAHLQPGSASGRIHLYRPSDARLDEELPLALSAAGVQHLDARHLRSGLWKIRVQWTVAGQEYYVDERVVIQPAPCSA